MYLGFLSLDIIVLIALFAILFFITWSMEKKLIVSLIVATYPTLLIFTYFPYLTLKAGLPQAVWFLVLYVIIAGITWSQIKTRHTYGTVRKVSVYGVLVLTYIALAITMTVHFVPALQYIYSFNDVVSQFVATIEPGLILIFPIVAILVTNKRDI